MGKYSTIFLVIIIGLIGFGYFEVTGTPWGKTAFANQVEDYIQRKYPSVNITKQTVSYSFKGMAYHSTVILNEGITIELREYDERIIDNYYVAKWEAKVTKEIDLFIKGNVNSNASAKLLINAANSEMEPYNNLSSFKEVSKYIQGKSKFFVYLSEDLLNEEALKEGLAVIRWVEEKGYTSNLVFFVNKEPVIIIESDQIKSISSPEDLKKFKKKFSDDGN
ncbi:YfjL-like protein [Paenibacillus chitinolyticus]|uniref:YfjL-like protein n=1 Tax=Paenibacillus chitinolyticus TaxID=79263 RepID=UPI00365FAAB3